MLEKDWLWAAYNAALESPDPSTQNGSVIIYDNVSKMITSCNTFPEGINHFEDRLVRPLKYNFIEHAERNVLYKALKMGINIKGAIMCVPWAACSDCARAIICSGIKKLIVHKSMMDQTPEHWKETISHANTMFHEAGVEVISISGKIARYSDFRIRFNGKLWTP